MHRCRLGWVQDEREDPTSGGCIHKAHAQILEQKLRPQRLPSSAEAELGAAVKASQEVRRDDVVVERT